MNFLNNIKSLLFQFIPIFGIFMYAAYPKKLVDFSNTFLGKAIAVGIIAFYSFISKLHGAVACAIIILLYQENYKEGFDYVNEFKKQQCKKGVLTYKNVDVNIQMTEHIFPELKYKNKVCNPCDESCEYDIIEEKLETEKKMIPQKSNDWTDKIVASLSDIPFNPKKSQEPNAEYFSKYK